MKSENFRFAICRRTVVLLCLQTAGKFLNKKILTIKVDQQLIIQVLSKERHKTNNRLSTLHDEYKSRLIFHNALQLIHLFKTFVNLLNMINSNPKVRGP